MPEPRVALTWTSGTHRRVVIIGDTPGAAHLPPDAALQDRGPGGLGIARACITATTTRSTSTRVTGLRALVYGPRRVAQRNGDDPQRDRRAAFQAACQGCGQRTAWAP